MGYRLKVDASRLGRGAKFIWAPKFPVVDGARVAGFRNGKYYAGDEFEWFGDPANPPAGCVPAEVNGVPDPEAVAAYEALAARRKAEGVPERFDPVQAARTMRVPDAAVPGTAPGASPKDAQAFHAQNSKLAQENEELRKRLEALESKATKPKASKAKAAASEAAESATG